jgi:hypothetical protein
MEPLQARPNIRTYFMLSDVDIGQFPKLDICYRVTAAEVRYPFVAHRDILLSDVNLVAFGAKRTSACKQLPLDRSKMTQSDFVEHRLCYFTRRTFSLPASTFSGLAVRFVLPETFFAGAAKYRPPFLLLLLFPLRRGCVCRFGPWPESEVSLEEVPE